MFRGRDKARRRRDWGDTVSCIIVGHRSEGRFWTTRLMGLLLDSFVREGHTYMMISKKTHAPGWRSHYYSRTRVVYTFFTRSPKKGELEPEHPSAEYTSCMVFCPEQATCCTYYTLLEGCFLSETTVSQSSPTTTYDHHLLVVPDRTWTGHLLLYYYYILRSILLYYTLFFSRGAGCSVQTDRWPVQVFCPAQVTYYYTLSSLPGVVLSGTGHLLSTIIPFFPRGGGCSVQTDRMMMDDVHSVRNNNNNNQYTLTIVIATTTKNNNNNERTRFLRGETYLRCYLFTDFLFFLGRGEWAFFLSLALLAL